MDEEVVITTPEPSPEPVPSPELEPIPTPEPEPTPPAPEPADPVTVVSVDELVDRLVQSAQENEESGGGSEALTAESDVIPGEGDIGVDDVVPGLIGDVVDILLGIRKGMENVEGIEQVVNHPALTTPFQDYTVTEGLLLLLLLFFFLKACMDMIRRAFSWLL